MIKNKKILPRLLILFLIPHVSYSRNIKLLVLIIASDDQPIYQEEQKLWRRYMHYNPTRVSAYFLKGNSNLPTNYTIKKDIIWAKTDEGLPPQSASLINKTVLALEALEHRLDDFDFILRTNLSSFFIFPRLLDFLTTLPQKNVYWGHGIGKGAGAIAASGAGFIVSPDVAKIMLRHKHELINNCSAIDDVLIGQFMKKQGITRTDYRGRIDIPSLGAWHKIKNALPKNAFHFRLKNTVKRRIPDEIFVQSQLINIFY